MLVPFIVTEKLWQGEIFQEVGDEEYYYEHIKYAH